MNVSLNADGNTLAVSAYFESSSSTGINGEQNDKIPQAGAVYVFTRTRRDLVAAGVHQGVEHRPPRESQGSE